MKRSIIVPLCLAALLCALLAGCREERQENFSDADAKPVLYLYPEEETEVNVRLDYGGELTCTYPAYGREGWTVTAAPDGTLTDKGGQTYNYLYWEGLSDGDYDFSRGFCVPGEDVAAFLEESLAKLGLTRREANEFIVYWLPKMQDNDFNLVAFQFERYTDHAGLTITPEPDSLLRVFMAWRPVEGLVEIPEQDLPAFARKGFAVVEWGGAELRYLTKQEAEQLIASCGTITVAEEETTLDLPFALRPQRTVTLYRYDGETVSSVSVYEETVYPEKSPLEAALGSIKGRAVTNWSVPENPWPVYKLSIGGNGLPEDYEALYCRGVWLDNQGNALLAEVDFPAVWKQFAKDAKPTQVPPRALALLALREGRWNHWFMVPSSAENLDREVIMTLDASGENLSWTIQNGGGSPLCHSNGGGAWLEVSLAGWWYTVPLPPRAITMEGHILPPGKSYTSSFAKEYYSGLPDGNYRLVFPLYSGSPDQETQLHSYTAASFQLKDGAPVVWGSRRSPA